MSKAGHIYFTNINPIAPQTNIPYYPMVNVKPQPFAKQSCTKGRAVNAATLALTNVYCPKMGPLLGTRLLNGKEWSTLYCLYMFERSMWLVINVCLLEGSSSLNRYLRFKRPLWQQRRGTDWQAQMRCCTDLWKVGGFSDGLSAEDSCHTQDTMTVSVDFQETLH